MDDKEKEYDEAKRLLDKVVPTSQPLPLCGRITAYGHLVRTEAFEDAARFLDGQGLKLVADKLHALKPS